MVIHARSWVGRLSLALSTALSLSAAAAHARACTCGVWVGRGSVLDFPKPGATGFPTNGLFAVGYSPSGIWHDIAGVPLVLVEDSALTALTGGSIRRPVGGLLPAGQTFYVNDERICPGIGVCTQQFTVGSGPDLTPPSRAIFRELSVQYMDVTPDGGAFCATDSLRIIIDGTDDTTPSWHLGVVLYAAPTMEAVRALHDPTIILAYTVSNGRALEEFVSYGLGAGRGHTRAADAGIIQGPAPFCIAVALMDWAGNIGERTDIRCLDTSNPRDPGVRVVGYRDVCNPGCSVPLRGGRTPRPAIGWIAVAIAVSLTRRKQAHKRSRVRT